MTLHVGIKLERTWQIDKEASRDPPRVSVSATLMSKALAEDA